MSTKVECTVCNEVLEVTANTIVLPFVCSDCELRAAMAPIAKVKIPAIEIKPYTDFQTATELVADEHAGLDESQASVENTTLLIEDLELQVSEQKKLNDAANTLIADMSAQLNEDASELGTRDQRIAALESQLSKVAASEYDKHMLNEKLQQKMSILFDRISALRNGITKMAYKSLLKDVAIAKYVGENFQLAEDADKEIRDLKNKLVLAEIGSDNVNRIRQMQAEVIVGQEQELKGKSILLADAYERLKHVRERRDWWRSEAVELNRTNKSLRKRGLLSRIRNAGA